MPYKRFSLLGSIFSIPQISPDLGNIEFFNTYACLRQPTPDEHRHVTNSRRTAYLGA
jgi:hypothetical protein